MQENAYNKDDDVIKATSFEVISTLREVLKTSSLWKDRSSTCLRTHSQLSMTLTEAAVYSHYFEDVAGLAVNVNQLRGTCPAFLQLNRVDI